MEIETKNITETNTKAKEENVEVKNDLSNTKQSGLVVEIGEKQNKF